MIPARGCAGVGRFVFSSPAALVSRAAAAAADVGGGGGEGLFPSLVASHRRDAPAARASASPRASAPPRASAARSTAALPSLRTA
eukprot:24566-Pelagococcus_subviridis.AAC.17